MDLPFKRVYIDIPSDVHARMGERCKDLGKTHKAYVADLIAADVDAAATPKKTRARKGRKTQE